MTWPAAAPGESGSAQVHGGLSDVLPSVARALGVAVNGGSGSVNGARLQLPEARTAVVVLVDGLGDRLLTRRGGHAPFLRQLRASGSGASGRGLPGSGLPGSGSSRAAANGGACGGVSGAAANGGAGAAGGDGTAGSWTLAAGFPSTTATSMGTFGTGELPGAHGMVGLDVLDPARGILFSQLAWDPDVDPHTWQPVPTVFEQVARAGLDVVRIGPGYFDGSGLTEAALRGGRFVAAEALADRVDAAVTAVEGIRRLHGAAAGGLIYLYWGDVDKAGHVYGCESWEWGEAVALIDHGIRELVRRLGPATLVAVTADHGMVDVPMSDRIDVAGDPELTVGVRHVGGEPRALHLYCESGAAPDVLATWRERLAGRMQVHSREGAVAAGWFGRVAPFVLPRIGDVVVAAEDRFAVVDSRTARPELLRLIGLHGARTAEETHVPLITTLGQASR